MPTIKPFAALRPDPNLAGSICELPYDVMSSEEARELASDNPLSFLHVSKPEIDLAPGTDLYSDAVYAKGRENFLRLIQRGALRQDRRPAFYLYRQVMGGHSQIGLVAAASCEEYLQGRIKKHELTRPDKEADRVRHIETLNSQTGPVFLVCRATEVMDQLVSERSAKPPEVDFTAKDGVRHSSWVLDDAADCRTLAEQVAGLPALYIADGHHRCAAAARVCQARQAAGESGYFLSVIFSHRQAQILPYNRVLKDLHGMALPELLEKLRTVFTFHSAPGDWTGAPKRKHELGLYVAGQWYAVEFRRDVAATTNPIESLDVSLLQEHVLRRFFGIEDPRTSNRINFVGGIRGTRELERLVDSGDYACAFSMYPTGIEDLMAVADSGGIMPPKSTWFEPKLRDGMFCHMLGEQPPR